MSRLALVWLLAFTAPLLAAPLDRIPKEANLVLVVEHPRQLAVAGHDLPAYRAAEKSLPGVREFLDSTPVRRFYQFVTFAEKELGASWPELLDKTAGGGIALGLATGTDPAPSLLVARGTDAKTVAAAYALFLRVLEEEAARQTGSEAKGKLQKIDYHGLETVRLGDEFHAAQVGTDLFISNNQQALALGLDLALKRTPGGSLADRPEPAAAKKLLGGDPLAWLWFDLAKTKQSKQAMDFFANTRKDLFQTLVFGSTADAVRRADFVAVGLEQSVNGFSLTLRLPAKRADLPPEFVLHVPPAEKPGSLPLLAPQGVIYSQSFYLDLAALWSERDKIINEQQRKDIEKAEQQISKVLPGTTLGTLLEQSGPYHRFVVAHRKDQPYRVEPAQPLPAAAFVTTFRDPAFGRTASAALRGGAFLASTQFGLTMSEEAIDDITLVSYRFPEKGPYPGRGDPENYRFNFVPSFAVVGENLVVATRPELVKDLIPELKKTPDPARSSPAVWRARGHAAGLAELIRAYPDQTISNIVLGEGVGLEQAQKQVAELVAWIQTLGTAGLSVEHRADAFQVRVEWKIKK